MEYRLLGNSGVRVSVIGLGTNQFGGKVDQQGVNRIIDGVLELGVNFIDTANIYTSGRSEETLGQALKGRRQQIILATKGFHPVGKGPNERGASRYHLINAVEQSLRRLQSDYIDLYQIHAWDNETPIEESMRALDALVQSGKIRYIGASNFAAWQLARSNTLAEVRGWEPFITIQPHYHMLERGIEHELLPYCAAFKIGILPYYPLAGGFLTGKYRRDSPAPAGSRGETSAYVQRYMNEKNYTLIEKLRAWAQQHDRNMGELAHAWLLAHPQVSSVISGATSLEHVQGNAKSADWKLSDLEMQEIEALLE